MKKLTSLGDIFLYSILFTHIKLEAVTSVLMRKNYVPITNTKISGYDIKTIRKSLITLSKQKLKT